MQKYLWLLTIFGKRFNVDVDRVLNMPRILNMPTFWIYGGSEHTICQGSGYTTVLNMPGLHRVLKTLEYARIIPGYAWSCLNVPKSVWMAFLLHLLVVMPCLKELQIVFLKSKNLIFICSCWKYLILFIVLD